MSTLFALAFLCSLPMMLVGLINPRWVFPKFVESPSRKLAVMVYGVGGLASMIVSGSIASTDSVPTAEADQAEVSTPVPSPNTASPSASPSPPSPPVDMPVQSVDGLGISRDVVQERFENPSVGFTFRDSTAVDGRPRIKGTSPDRLARLELIGQPSNLIEAHLLVGLPSDSSEIMTLNALYTAGFFKLMDPDWTEASDWLTENLKQLADGEQSSATIVRGKKRFELSYLDDPGLFVLSVSPVQESN